MTSKIEYNALGSTSLQVSPAGFGSYRVHISVKEHREALEYALVNGINLIDTSSNYANGGSEELIGVVLKELISENKINRDNIVLVSKVGYLQGQNYGLSQRLKRQRTPFPELVEYAPGLEYCIHPDFIADQLIRSLKRLQQSFIDVYLLHNPEYYLMWAQKNGISLVTAQKEYYRRIEQAFMHLEIEARNGRIKYYGISSNTFPVSSKRNDFTSLQKVWDIAESISKSHKFRVIQFPMNLLETGAATEINQPNGQNILDLAIDNNIGVLINRPFNAFSNNKMTRLVHVVSKVQPTKNMFDEVTQLENQFISEILPLLSVKEDKQKELAGLFSMGMYLRQNLSRLASYWTWMENQSLFISKQVSHAVQMINDIPDKEKKVIEWLNSYVEAFNRLLNEITTYLGFKAAQESQKLYEAISPVDAECRNTHSLTELALRSLRSTKGISSVLVGMRRTDYVNDILTELQFDVNVSDKTESWQKVKNLLDELK